MCRSTETDYNHQIDGGRHGRRLKIKSFFLHLSLSSSSSSSSAASVLPDCLTLLFLPRINGSPLHVNSSKIRPHTPAFLTLHRVLTTAGGVVFAARDHVRLSHGLTFEVHLGHYRFLKGIFHVNENSYITTNTTSISWKMECKCVLLDSDSNSNSSTNSIAVADILSLHLTEAELSVAVVDAGGEVMMMMMREKVPININSRTTTTGTRPSSSRGRRKCRRFKMCLAQIPEEEEEEEQEQEDESGDCQSMSASNGTCSDEFDGNERQGQGDVFVDSIDNDIVLGVLDMDMDMEGVRWAVHVGFWVMCLGMGFFVSRVSANKLRHRNFLL